MDLKTKGTLAGRLACALALSAAIGLFAAPVSAETVKISLADSVQMALANNRTIKQSLADVDAAHEQLHVANRSAGPLLTWDWTAARVGGKAKELLQPPSPYKDTYENKATLAMVLFDAGMNAQRKEARYGLNAADLTLEQTKQTIRLTATTDYFNILQARNMVQVREETVATLTKHLDDVNAQFRAGTVARADVLASEVELANAQQALTSAKNDYAVAVATLNNVIGLPTDTTLETSDEMRYTAYDLALSDCTDYGLVYRADAAAAHYTVKQAEAAVEQAAAANLPTLNAAATRSIAGEHAFKNSMQAKDMWTLGLIATWGIFDNEATTAQVHEAKAKLRKAEEALAATNERIRLDVHTAYLNLRAAEQNIDTTEKAVKQAEEDYNIARVRYNAGVGTNLEVMRSSDNLTTARTNYATALYRYNTSKAALDNAMGVPVDLDAMQYRRVIDHGKRARAAREAAVLHEDALLETPKGAQVRPAEPAPTAEEAAASIERVRAANAAYEMTMAK